MTHPSFESDDDDPRISPRELAAFVAGQYADAGRLGPITMPGSGDCFWSEASRTWPISVIRCVGWMRRR